MEALQKMIHVAESLSGPVKDPKLNLLISELSELVEEGFAPVVFCRYIATAHYLHEHISKKFKKNRVEVITGELAPVEREERVNSLLDCNPILIATDCLSEGINLQSTFNAVIHYDLSWNPTRHEQREGRVDRFGQRSPTVKTVLMYGENNPVDGAVLDVILRKAKSIQKELGVAVPLPDDENRVSQAILQSVLLKSKDKDVKAEQMVLDLGIPRAEEGLHEQWENVRNRTAQNRTIFSQRGLQPTDVLPEWQKTITALGGERELEEFVSEACKRLGAPLEQYRNHYKLPVKFLPQPLQERIALSSTEKCDRIDFKMPSARGAAYIHRTHPLVSVLAEFVAESALSGDVAGIASRAGAIFTGKVERRTVLLLIRLRNQIAYSRIRTDAPQILLAEEAIHVALVGNEILTGDVVKELLSCEPERNMADSVKVRHIENALEMIASAQGKLSELADERAAALLEDHRRVRDASNARGTYTVKAIKPVDIIGAYVLVPLQTI